MVRRLIAGDDLASLQVLWQPEFIPAKPPDFPSD
jgi:LacI family transcriptional regulator